MMTRKKAKHMEEVELNDLPEDIWVKIFNKIDEKCLFETAYCVCRQWRSICRLILFWYHETRLIRFLSLKNIVADEGYELVRLLKITMDQLRLKFGSISVNGLCFPPHVIYLSDDQLYYIAKRLPSLKSLRLLCTTNMITKAGFSNAFRYWTEIESILIGPLSPSNYTHIIQEIGFNCKNLQMLIIHTSDLKGGHTFVLDEHTSLVIANCLHQLRILYLQRIIIYKSGLEIIMSKCLYLDSIIVLWGKHAHSRGTPKYHCTRKGEVAYSINKIKIEDGALVWAKVAADVEKRFTSPSSLVNKMWRFDDDRVDRRRLERFSK